MQKLYKTLRNVW